MKKIIFIVMLGFAGFLSAKSTVKNEPKIVNENVARDTKIETSNKESLKYKYYYGMGAVDTPNNGTCFTYGQYTCLDDDSYCTFTPHNTGGTVPTTCLGDGTYQA
ncbi:hypothetical protein [Chryseobacterium arthrosphaerae]|nr:hypothetical protein [Chryseobacterium arthrosphaerae]